MQPSQTPSITNVSVFTLYKAQELCESWSGCPALPILISLMVSVDVNQHWTMHTHWSQFVPNISTQHPRTLSSTSSFILYHSICDSVWSQWRQGNPSKSEMHIWSTVLHYTVSQALKTSIKVCSGFKRKTFVSSGFSTERTLIFLSCELLQHFGTVYGVLVQLQHTRSLACFHNQQWKESTHNGVN